MPKTVKKGDDEYMIVVSGVTDTGKFDLFNYEFLAKMVHFFFSQSRDYSPLAPRFLAPNDCFFSAGNFLCLDSRYVPIELHLPPRI